MAKYSLCCIGYLTKDKLVTSESTVDMTGGTAYYFAEAMNRLCPEDFQLITLPEEDQVQAKQDLFQDIDAEVIHIGNLFQANLSVDTIKFLATKGLLSADIPSSLCNGKVLAADWEEKCEMLKYVHTLRANYNVVCAITECGETHEAALMLAALGVKEVVLTLGKQGSLIYAKGEFTEVPSYPVIGVVDAAGCGDTYMAGYLYQRSKGASYQEAGNFASAMCTIKLQSHGPFNSSEDVVRKIMSTSSSMDRLGVCI